MAADQGRQRTNEAGQPRAALRALPGVSKLLTDPEIMALAGGMPPAYLSQLIATEIDAARTLLLAGESPETSPRERVLARLRSLFTPKLRPVINATGVVLHTNLGRAPVSAATAAAMADALRAYTPLELDLATGGRGGRMAEIEALLAMLTGAEAALVVNNNAAATFSRSARWRRGAQ